jgi:hypothetical protein
LCNVVLYCINSNLIIVVIVLYEFVFKYLYRGTDAMGSKSKKQAVIKNNSIVRKHRINKKDSEDARR